MPSQISAVLCPRDAARNPAEPCLRRSVPCHAFAVRCNASAIQRPRQYLTMPSPRLSFRCYAIAVLRPCATPPHRGPLFRREADRRCALARHSFAAAKPHHACAHRFPAVPMRCMSSLCNALPAQRSAVPMHYHSCAHQCRRHSLPYYAFASLLSAVLCHSFARLSPCFATLCPGIASQCLGCSALIRATTVPYYAFTWLHKAKARHSLAHLCQSFG